MIHSHNVHPHSQSHQHHHNHIGGTGQRLKLAFLMSAVILVAEVAGGIVSNSLAVLSDAGHVLTDLFALGLAWFAAVQATRPATPRRTYGFHRAGILAALLNALTLVVVSVVITWEAIRRLQSPDCLPGDHY